MQIIKRYIFDTKLKIEKSAFIWNMIAGLFSAVESVILSMVVTRTCGLTDAGVVTIAYAIANLMATIGKFGVRTFQVTDIKDKYAFASYFHARIATVVLMLISSMAYIVYCHQFKGYKAYKMAVVMIVCIRFMIEACEDVFAGECQRRGRLDAASRMFILRSAIFTITFLTSVISTHQLIVSLLISLTCAMLIESVILVTVTRNMRFRMKLDGFIPVKEILWACFPLFLSAFFFFYITNAPKYAIDSVMNDEIQACYSFIAFPVFTIELLNNFMYQPVLVDMAKEWNNGEYQKVKSRIFRQLIIILCLTCMALIGGFLLGIPVLSLVFSTDLSAYKAEMLVLLIGGGLLAVIGYLSTFLVTMRKNWEIIYGYIVIFILSVALYVPIIKHYGMMGGVILYCILCLCFSIYEYAVIQYNIYIKSKKESDFGRSGQL